MAIIDDLQKTIRDLPEWVVEAVERDQQAKRRYNQEVDENNIPYATPVAESVFPSAIPMPLPQAQPVWGPREEDRNYPIATWVPENTPHSMDDRDDVPTATPWAEPLYNIPTAQVATPEQVQDAEIEHLYYPPRPDQRAEDAGDQAQPGPVIENDGSQLQDMLEEALNTTGKEEEEDLDALAGRGDTGIRRLITLVEELLEMARNFGHSGGTGIHASRQEWEPMAGSIHHGVEDEYTAAAPSMDIADMYRPGATSTAAGRSSRSTERNPGPASNWRENP